MSYCVYKHTFPNGKVYIGITGQKPERRWGNGGVHYLTKRNNKYTQPLMAHAIIKYGWENIKHEVVCNDLNKYQAEKMEIELIDYYKSDTKAFGYNIDHGGSVAKVSEESKKKNRASHLGKQHTVESKQKISTSLKGRILTDEHKRKISNSHKKENLSEQSILNMSLAQIGKKRPKEMRRHMLESSKFKKSVMCIETNIIYVSTREAERETGIDHSTISRVCLGKQHTAGNYHWQYV